MSLDPSTQALIAYLTIFLAPGFISGAVTHWSTPRVVHQARKSGITNQDSEALRKAANTGISIFGIGIIAFPILLSWAMPLIGEEAVQIYKSTYIIAFFAYLLVDALTGRFLTLFVPSNPELERAAAQRFLADMANTAGEEEEKQEPDLIFMNIPLYQPVTDMQPFKAMRDFARRTGGDDSDSKSNTSTASKETA
jgi:hypothetical protein